MTHLIWLFRNSPPGASYLALSPNIPWKLSLPPTYEKTHGFVQATTFSCKSVAISSSVVYSRVAVRRLGLWSTATRSTLLLDFLTIRTCGDFTGIDLTGPFSVGMAPSTYPHLLSGFTHLDFRLLWLTLMMSSGRKCKSHIGCVFGCSRLPYSSLLEQKRTQASRWEELVLSGGKLKKWRRSSVDSCAFFRLRWLAQPVTKQQALASS